MRFALSSKYWAMRERRSWSIAKRIPAFMCAVALVLRRLYGYRVRLPDIPNAYPSIAWTTTGDIRGERKLNRFEVYGGVLEQGRWRLRRARWYG